MPVRSSSTDAYWPVSPIVCRTWRASRTTSKPATRADPAVGGEQRGQDAHRGRLAGAVRPEDAEHGAFADGEVDAGEGLGGAESLGQAFGLDRVRV